VAFSKRWRSAPIITVWRTGCAGGYRAAPCGGQEAENHQGGEEGATRLLAVKLAELKAVQERLRDELCATEGIVETCHAVIEEGELMVTLYDSAFRIIARKADLKEYQGEAASIEAKCRSNSLECRQQMTELAALYEEAVAARPAARAAMEALSGLSRATLMAIGPLKRMSRASEKLLVPYPNGAGSADQICDVVRDMFECSSLAEVAEILRLIGASPTIQVVRFKDRISNPSGGWRDAMLNYRVTGSSHICELQIAHVKMLKQRKDMGGHEAYADERNARASCSSSWGRSERRCSRLRWRRWRLCTSVMRRSLRSAIRKRRHRLC
jgi:hypothetical protein